MGLFDKALAFAKKKFNEKYKRDGVMPYNPHYEKVASLLESEYEKVAAHCHDLIESYLTSINEPEQIKKYNKALRILADVE